MQFVQFFEYISFNVFIISLFVTFVLDHLYIISSILNYLTQCAAVTVLGQLCPLGYVSS